MNRTCLVVLVCLTACGSSPSSECFPDEVACSSGCANLAISAANCGACGVTCACDEICVEASCRSAALFTEGDVAVGTPCDPAASPGTIENPCADGFVPAPDGGTGNGMLVCDPIGSACAAACRSNTDCRAGFLGGYICDNRTLEEIDPSFAGDSTSRDICVHPSCF